MDNPQEQTKRQEDRTILINFVLDKSGSMDVIRQATIAGFNQFLRDQQQEGGSATMTLTLFDTRFQTVVKAAPLAEVQPLDERTYAPGGMTALYDAIGHTMAITDRYVADHKPDQVLFVIMTDGFENSSREFDQPRILELVENRQKNADYEFVYLGANQDAYAVGGSIGIRGGRTLDYGASPVQAMAVMERASWNVKAHRRSGAKTFAAGTAFSPEFEGLGKTSYEEHKAKLAEQAPDAAAGPAGTADDEEER